MIIKRQNQINIITQLDSLIAMFGKQISTIEKKSIEANKPDTRARAARNSRVSINRLLSVSKVWNRALRLALSTFALFAKFCAPKIISVMDSTFIAQPSP